jgi:hypothetical protein
LSFSQLKGVETGSRVPTMRTIARWIGGLWLGAAFLAAIVVSFINGARADHMGTIIPISGVFGDVYIYIALGIPGVILLAWGERGKSRSKDVG